MKPILVNLGCGARHHPDWLNFDIHSTSPDVHACNLLDGVPLPANYCDAVYNAALLEHLPPGDAQRFLGECHRILKPGGILRIGVPDLERIARTYLAKLEAAVRGDPNAHADYQWILLELLDQLARTRPGGEMVDAIRNREFNEDFVVARIGDEYRMLQGSLSGDSKWARVRKMPAREIRHRVWRALVGAPTAARRLVGSLVLSSGDARALRIGLFRVSGEVHQWMYDRYSLTLLLQRCGFREAKVQSFSSSQIDSNWSRYGLDANDQGEALKPDLTFVEAIK